MDGGRAKILEKGGSGGQDDLAMLQNKTPNRPFDSIRLPRQVGQAQTTRKARPDAGARGSRSAPPLRSRPRL